MSWPLATLLFFILSISAGNVLAVNQCLKDLKEVTPRRFFQLENDLHNITLETSGRLGHQLVTQAFMIFLKEVLGYDSVQLVIKEDHFNASGVLNRLAGEGEDGASSTWGVRSGRIPDTMINLAVWLSPEIELEEWTSQGLLESCGHLGFPGKFGWFTPNTQIYRDNKKLDYWRTYADDLRLASLFSLSPQDSLNASLLSRDADGNYYCRESYCTNGVYEPEICRGKDCAVLLVSYAESSSYVPAQIHDLKLYVRVVYVGPNLDPFVRHLLQKYNATGEKRGVLFFSWKPTLLTTELDLISVSLPSCNTDSYCNYESGKLEKIVWSKLKDGAKQAYESIHRLSLTLEEYTSYLQLYKKSVTANPNENIASVACTWMKENKPIWKTWKSGSESEKTVLYIGGIFPITGTYTEQGIVVAANMATRAVNANDMVLKDYILRVHSFDGQCKADMVMKSFIDYIRLSTFPHMAGILGPACSDTVEPLAGVARHFKTVVISYSAEGSSFSDREQYPYFFRTIGENKQYRHVYLELFRELEWGRVASLTEEGQKYAEYVSHLHDLLQENGITFVANRKFPKERAHVNMSQYLQDLKSKKAKIIVGDFYDHAARAVMCEAYRQQMTAREGYVWFLPIWFIDDWYDTDRYNVISGKDAVPCNTSEMIQAINGHLSLQHAYFAPDEEIMQENITIGDWRNNYSAACTKVNLTTSDYAGYAYDAVWTYAYALDKLLKNNQSHIANLHSAKTTKTFVEIINKTDFHGVSGHIKFIGGPSRLSAIHLVQWLNRKTTIVGTFNPITLDKSNEVFSGKLNLNKSAIVWLNPAGTIPSDGSEPPPTCVLETLASALEVSCEIAIVIANVIGFTILGMILVVCFIVIKMRYDQRVRKTEDYMKSLGIDMLSVASVSALDKWEIPRDRVVINRKLGEGAFGTVYGGECFSDEKGWVAVAVKTLKMGSTLEQKVDFLSEAEVMKRFEHKNIVKLLGVCTKNEPVYTIMEFMLYGDLKTYLLARRHLVNEKNCEESDEISNKRLTQMTLDVARALSYLAELKYVHRDVACRNCLVNASRVVKLGDFGMTRPMYENDYYRLNRKGMLPVRWMAPESLAVGIFTPASDVWSFGVLLYEIITFGSFPFQGLSNNQVLEVVKAGNIINIPDGVKPQLENLLLSCWAFETSRRPHASEIVEFLANNPRIISPCLDIPLASVQLEGADVLEIELPRRRNRKIVRQNTDSSPGGQVLPELVPLTDQGCTNRESQNQSQSSPYATLQSSCHLLDSC